MTKYFRVTDDMALQGRWYLRAPTLADGTRTSPWQFTTGHAIPTPERLSISLRRAGEALPFTFADYDIPVVTDAVVERLLSEAPDQIQGVPAVVGASAAYCVLNVTHAVACLDEAHSEFTKWTEHDRRPDRMGAYREVTNLKIDPGHVGNLKIFRITGWEIALIVDDEIKHTLLEVAQRGLTFVEV